MNIKRCKIRSKSECQWLAEAKIYRDLKNPQWELSCEFADKLVNRSRLLPMSESGIPGKDERPFSGCVLFKSMDIKLLVHDGVILFCNGNVIELKHDIGGKIENAILDSAPNDIYKEICNFL